MTLTHLLDTSVYSQPLRRKPLAEVEHRWRELGDSHACTSVVCEAEVLAGLEWKGSKSLWRAYEKILQGRLPVLNVDLPVAETYAELWASTQEAGTPRASFDLLIAATAKAHGLIVATCNPKHFRGLEGVAMEDWTGAAE